MTKWIFLIFIVITAILSVFFIRFILVPLDEYPEEVVDIPYDKHVQVVVKSSGEYFWKQFQEGALAAGKDNNTYVEFVPQTLMTNSELQRLLESGGCAGVDGIALQPLDLPQTNIVVDALKKEGIYLVTYESGAKLLPDVPTVGSNYFNTGTMAGHMAVEAVSSGARAVVLLNQSDTDEDAQQQNTIIQGMIDSTLKIAEFEIVQTIVIDPEKFEAESVIEELIRSKQPPDIIVCFDEKSTPAVAQAILDSGGVGEIKVIGYGAMPQTLDYIKRGVIYGSVFPDAYETGYKTVELLRNMIDEKQVSDYTNPTLHRIDKSNVEEYIMRQSEE